MQAIKELRSALSLPRPADYEGEGHSALTPLANRDGIRLGPILARLRQSDNHEGYFFRKLWLNAIEKR